MKAKPRSWDEWRAVKAEEEAKLPVCAWCDKLIYPQEAKVLSVMQGGAWHTACALRAHNAGIPT